MKMIAIRESYGYLGRHWKKGEVVEVQKGCKDKSLKHFAPLASVPKSQPVSPAFEAQPPGSEPKSESDKESGK